MKAAAASSRLAWALGVDGHAIRLCREKTVGSHHGCIRAAFAATPVMTEATARDLVTPESSEAVAVPFVPPDGTLDVSGQPRRLVARTTQRYEAVQALLAEGSRWRRSAGRCGWTIPPSAASPEPEASTNSWSKPPAGCPYWTSTSPIFMPAGWRAVTTFPSSTGNWSSADSPAASSASAVTSAPSDVPAKQDESSSRCPGRSPGRPRSPDVSSAGS
jgi:hypothetical protein